MCRERLVAVDEVVETGRVPFRLFDVEEEARPAEESSYVLAAAEPAVLTIPNLAEVLEVPEVGRGALLGQEVLAVGLVPLVERGLEQDAGQVGRGLRHTYPARCRYWTEGGRRGWGRCLATESAHGSSPTR